MARLQQTQRKRVGSVPRLPVDVVAAIAAEKMVVKLEKYEDRGKTKAMNAVSRLSGMSWEKIVDCFCPGKGLMPACFKIITTPHKDGKGEERLDADFGESAIGRVAPVDSGNHPIRYLIETGFNADERCDTRLYFGAKNLNRMAYQVGSKFGNCLELESCQYYLKHMIAGLVLLGKEYDDQDKKELELSY
ncbi:hypothetical protein AgCh_022039 [Apium graveolens]